MFRSFAVFLLAVVAAHPLQNPDAPAIEDTFNLFAYGDNISGLPVFYADGKAQIGDPTLSKATIAQPIYFTTSPSSPTIWIAHPNTTEITEAEFTTQALYLPETDDSTAAVEVSFAPPEQSVKKKTAVFSVYGNYVLIGFAGANFYAGPTGVDGVYALLWSESSGEEIGSDKIPLILRTTAPATDSVLEG